MTGSTPTASDLVWYASYGSNLSTDRLLCYLRGGRPEGAARTYSGSRDGAPPRASVPLTLPGRIYFAGRSTAWGGGMAFYDPLAPGPTPSRAHLVTIEQFADIAAQERDEEPRPDGPVEDALRDPGLLAADGADHLCGDGLYARLLRVATIDGLPVLTFTATHAIDDVPHVAPTEPYLAMISRGLAESHGWSTDEARGYLDTRVGHRDDGCSVTPHAGRAAPM
ncbi:histone deacetylase [Gordonia shandongensis]|uniref:histone deacetylase n=1 Tax=Gordonia shandongensis TaxID=376351 RepID=UPI000411F442|nr:histone deacetylase [Gordonia shandongensis]